MSLNQYIAVINMIVLHFSVSLASTGMYTLTLYDVLDVEQQHAMFNHSLRCVQACLQMEIFQYGHSSTHVSKKTLIRAEQHNQAVKAAAA